MGIQNYLQSSKQAACNKQLFRSFKIKQMENPTEYYRLCGFNVSELLDKAMTCIGTAHIFNYPFGLVDEIKLSRILEVLIEVQSL